MFERIYSMDGDLLFVINGAHSYFTDCVMWLYSGRVVWIPITLFLIGFIVYKKSWKEWGMLLVAFVILFFLCDKITVEIVKPYFARLRPTHEPDVMEYVRVLHQYTGGRYGFVSSHSANAFGMAVFSSLLFKSRIYTLVIVVWALLMGYSRIYLGVHYPSDVLGGMLIGALIGCLLYFLYSFSLNNLSAKTVYLRPAVYSPASVRVLAIGLISYIIIFSLLSPFLVGFLH